MSRDNTSVLGSVGAGITKLRNFVINTFFVLVLLFVVVGSLSTCQTYSVPEGSALIINPRGVIVDALTYPSQWQDLVTASDAPGETELQSILVALEMAANDSDIKALVLDLDDLVYVSPAQANRIGDALATFKLSGKQIISYADFYGQEHYHIASYADAIYMHPLGQIFFSGYGGDQLYVKDLLDQFNVNVHVFRVGEFKSATEPLTRNSMSDAARRDVSALYQDLWQQLLADVAANRQVEPHALQDYADNIASVVRNAQGDMAHAALEAHLVDELLTGDQALTRIGDVVGYSNPALQELNAIDFASYLHLQQYAPGQNLAAPVPEQAPAGNIGVIVAQGPVVMEGDGRTASARHLNELIRGARLADDIHAVVLRVDSPGGSQFASELIRQELELLQVTGKPVVASFGSAAASGGYWIAATADAIVSEPASVTGSIGIFSMITTFEQTLADYGVHSDGVGTTARPLRMSMYSGISEDVGALLQARVEHGYDQFLNIVARGRNLDKAGLAEIAEGRVWSGEDALELGLVDQLGGLQEAMQTAAELAGLETWQARHLAPQLNPRQQFMAELMRNMGLAELAKTILEPVSRTPASQLSQLLDPYLRQLQNLQAMQDPGHLYAFCEGCWPTFTTLSR